MEYHTNQISALLLQAKELLNIVELYKNNNTAFYVFSEAELKLVREIREWLKTKPPEPSYFLEQANLTRYELAFLIGMLMLQDILLN